MKVQDIRLLIAAVLICFLAGACERPQWNKAEKMNPEHSYTERFWQFGRIYLR